MVCSIIQRFSTKFVKIIPLGSTFAAHVWCEICIYILTLQCSNCDTDVKKSLKPGFSRIIPLSYSFLDEQSRKLEVLLVLHLAVCILVLHYVLLFMAFSCITIFFEPFLYNFVPFLFYNNSRSSNSKNAQFQNITLV